MKRIVMKLLIPLLIFLSVGQCFAEGFAAGTLIKVPDGYTKIEDLRVGDCVICCDEMQNFVARSVVFITKQAVERYVSICVGDECLRAAYDQRFYSKKNDTWIAAFDLKKCDTLAEYDVTAVDLVEQAIDVYLVGVAEYHNFFATTADICAHNFFPVVLAITGFFGAGGIEIAGVSFGLAGLGTFLGYKWHKKSKRHNITLSPMRFDIAQESDDIYNANDAQAPGMPAKKDGYLPPKKWDGKKKTHPITGAVGWPDKKGKIWVPTGVGPKAHGGPHWDVQYPNGIDYDNVYPGGKIRPGR